MVKGKMQAKVLMSQRERMNLVRLERAMERDAILLSDWVPPPPPRDEAEYTSKGKRKRKPPSGPEDWKLRGCARPWESLNDGTLDPNGRPYDIREEGIDFFSTAMGNFWSNGNAATQEHIANRRELIDVYRSLGREKEALKIGTRALSLDATDATDVSSALSRLMLACPALCIYRDGERQEENYADFPDLSTARLSLLSQDRLEAYTDAQAAMRHASEYGASTSSACSVLLLSLVKKEGFESQDDVVDQSAELRALSCNRFVLWLLAFPDKFVEPIAAAAALVGTPLTTSITPSDQPREKRLKVSDSNSMLTHGAVAAAAEHVKQRGGDQEAVAEAAAMALKKRKEEQTALEEARDRRSKISDDELHVKKEAEKDQSLVLAALKYAAAEGSVWRHLFSAKASKPSSSSTSYTRHLQWLQHWLQQMRLRERGNAGKIDASPAYYRSPSSSSVPETGVKQQMPSASRALELFAAAWAHFHRVN